VVLLSACLLLAALQQAPAHLVLSALPSALLLPLVWACLADWEVLQHLAATSPTLVLDSLLVTL
jgi:hypothetical protein